jgi:hypothetical protein
MSYEKKAARWLLPARALFGLVQSSYDIWSEIACGNSVSCPDAEQSRVSLCLYAVGASSRSMSLNTVWPKRRPQPARLNASNAKSCGTFIRRGMTSDIGNTKTINIFRLALPFDPGMAFAYACRGFRRLWRSYQVWMPVAVLIMGIAVAISVRWRR